MTVSRRWLAAGLCMAGTAVLAGGIYLAWYLTPPGPPESVEQALSTIGSARYERMPAYRQSEYLEQTAGLMQDMDDQQRHELFRQFRTDESARRAMRKLHEDRVVRRLREFAEGDAAERRRVLDEIIDEMVERRERFEARREQGGDDARPDRQRFDRNERTDDGGDGERRRPDPRQRIQRHIEQGNPQIMALHMEMREALRKRMEERGIEMRGRGGRRGPGR